MFKALKQIAKNAKNLKTKVLFQIVFKDDSVQDFVIDLNAFEQLFKNSEFADGTDTPNYSLSTEVNYAQGISYEVTNSEGQSFRRNKTTSDGMFFFEDGDFYKSFKVKVLDDGFTIQADTIKPNRDLLEYGKILGLTDESKAKLVQKILPMVIEETKKAIRE